MTDWEFEHSIYTEAKKKDAWTYWSDMTNHIRMETSVDRIELDGPFISGSKGRTITKDYTQEWELNNVIQGSQFEIVGYTPDGKGMLSFLWKFKNKDSGTLLTQRIKATGPQVEQFIDTFLSMEKNAPIQMEKLAKDLNRLAKK